ncbi:MAG: nucleotidyltransferase domain-containing protein [Armatimonadetes bacterium]|nr:nucleotidyltransferase domain-containing protein [Armatimonadota bacterium]
MKAIEALKAFFVRESEVVAVYLYGRYASTQMWPDTDIEISLLFRQSMGPDEIGEYLERLPESNPLGGQPGILMPSALNTHILPAVYEILTSGDLLVDNDAEERTEFAAAAMARIQEERPAMLEEAKGTILKARSLPFEVGAAAVHILPQPARPMDPLRIGWRLGRVLASAAILEPATRELEATSRDAERVGQVIGWFSNAAGAATGIAKAMLTILGIPRPNRRWEVFLPLADTGLMTMELALHMAVAAESRWQLLTTSGFIAPERALAHIRSMLPPILSFARLAAWYTELPGSQQGQRLH